MLRELPFKKLLEWEAFDQLHPIGDRRGDWQAASICRVMMDIAAASCGSKKRFRNSDFLLEEFTDQEREPLEEPKQTWQEMKMLARMFATQSQADLTKKKKKTRR